MRILTLLLLLFCESTFAQTNADDQITIRTTKLSDHLYFLDCENGFGGGNVAVSVGDDGILLTDDMYAKMGDRLKAALTKLSDKPVRIVLNTHFHSDHIQGNKNFFHSAVIIAQENVGKQLLKKNKPEMPATDMMPAVNFKDSITVNFNSEDIRMIHFANSHTDGDAAVYFTQSKVLHLGDMFFFGMFPAVYTEGGGNIKQLVVSMDKILTMFPPDTKVIPGHGNIATMKDLADYTAMLKETISITEENMKKGKTLEQMKAEKVLKKYDALGDGGAQTTDQYLTMLYNLLK